MNDFPEINITEYEIKDAANALKIVNDQIFALNKDKEKLQLKIIDLLQHNKVGQEKYHKWYNTIEITKSIKKEVIIEKFEEFNRLKNWKFNPVKISEKFSVSTELVKECAKYGSEMDQKIMEAVIQYSKPYFTVKILPPTSKGIKSCPSFRV